MKNNKVLSLIGLATKAGKTVSGEFSTEKSVKQEMVSWHWWQMMPPKTQKRNFGICVPIMKFRYISFQTKRAWAEQWAKNSVPALPCRTKILQRRS